MADNRRTQKEGSWRSHPNQLDGFLASKGPLIRVAHTWGSGESTQWCHSDSVAFSGKPSTPNRANKDRFQHAGFGPAPDLDDAFAAAKVTGGVTHTVLAPAWLNKVRNHIGIPEVATAAAAADGVRPGSSLASPSSPAVLAGNESGPSSRHQAGTTSTELAAPDSDTGNVKISSTPTTTTTATPAPASLAPTATTHPTVVAGSSTAASSSSHVVQPAGVGILPAVALDGGLPAMSRDAQLLSLCHVMMQQNQRLMRPVIQAVDNNTAALKALQQPSAGQADKRG